MPVDDVKMSENITGPGQTLAGLKYVKEVPDNKEIEIGRPAKKYKSLYAATVFTPMLTDGGTVLPLANIVSASGTGVEGNLVSFLNGTKLQDTGVAVSSLATTASLADYAELSDLSSYVQKSGDTMAGTLSVAGGIVSFDTTEATGVSVGSIVTAGGLAVAKNIVSGAIIGARDETGGKELSFRYDSARDAGLIFCAQPGVAYKPLRLGCDNLAVQKGPDVTFGGASGAFGIANAETLPTSNPTGGGILYVEGGALRWRGSSGTDTLIASA